MANIGKMSKIFTIYIRETIRDNTGGPAGTNDDAASPDNSRVALDIPGPAGVGAILWVQHVQKTFDYLVNQTKDWVEETGRHLLEDVQGTIDVITEKARRGAEDEISFAEKTFLRSIYSGMVVGGWFKNLPEASKLMLHYLGNYGDSIEIDSGIYEKSNTVKKEMERQKKRAAVAMRRSALTFSDRSGTLFADYDRLKYADNRFILKSETRRVNEKSCVTNWRVDNTYNFEDFKGTDSNWRKVSKWSEFPVRGRTIIIYDGLSKYLIELDMAAEFDYWATWEEQWVFDSEQK